jgi:hypothetical protein
MYMYLRNRELGGTFALQRDAKVFIRCPQSLKDQIGPSTRYQHQREEMSRYFTNGLRVKYALPLCISIRAVLVELFLHPVGLVTYLVIFAYTRLASKSRANAPVAAWTVDATTKNV